MPDILPPEILDGFSKTIGKVQAVITPPQGTNSSVWRIEAESGAFIVKRNTDMASVAVLERESSVLQSLESFVPVVPRFVARVGDYFCFTCLDGVNLAVVFAQATDTETRAQLAAEYGRLLRILHGWKPAIPLPDRWFTNALRRAERNAQDTGLDTPVSSPGLWNGKSHRAVWEEIQQAKDNVIPQLVFCHGDWCLPNVLITAGHATGAVDWGNGGWSDYRMDLAMALWSLRYNSTTLLGDPHTDRYLDAFLRGYGYDEPAGALRFWEALSLLS